MKLSFIRPVPELLPHIETIWVFESPAGLPATDSSIAVPNGCCKITFTYGNLLVSVTNGRTTICPPERLYFVGNKDSSALLRCSAQKMGGIGIEFCPHGAFPIFGIPLGETPNVLWEADVIFGRWAREVQEVLNNLGGADERVGFLQDQLILLLRQNQSGNQRQKTQRGNELVAYCVEALKSAEGRISIRELQGRTGYSRRYLDMLFKQHVGLSPKVLAGIYRFQKFYRRWAEGQSFDLVKDDLYEYYYDQAHFTKEFKKMTGHAPGEYSHEVSNEYGRRLCLR